MIRGFFNFTGSGCDANRIWWVGGSGSSWKAERTPYLGRVLASDQSSGGFRARAFVAQGRSTDVNVAGGRTRVVWSELGDGTVLAERLGGGGWTKGTVYPAASRLRPIVLGTTVLMASARRIYARSERL